MTRFFVVDENPWGGFPSSGWKVLKGGRSSSRNPYYYFIIIFIHFGCSYIATAVPKIVYLKILLPFLEHLESKASKAF